MADDTPIRILVADDDSSARATIVDLLRSFGHVVVDAVGTGRQAVERAAQVSPDVVLLDVHMPDGSGIEAAGRIVESGASPAIVLFSGDPAISLSKHDVAATAAVAFLPKPTPPHMLDSTIRLAFSRSRELSAARKEAHAAKQQLEERKTIERAKGILMRRTGSSEQEAYRILQRTSQDRSVRMVDIAKAVLESEPGPPQDKVR
jgi:two-component system, response regulator PdtaR